MNNRVSLEPININGKWRALYCEDNSMCTFILKEGSMECIEFDTKRKVDMFIVDYKEKWGIKQ